MVRTSRAGRPAANRSTPTLVPSEANAHWPFAVTAAPNGMLPLGMVVMAVAEAGQLGAACVAIVQVGSVRRTTPTGLRLPSGAAGRAVLGREARELPLGPEGAPLLVQPLAQQTARIAIPAQTAAPARRFMP